MLGKGAVDPRSPLTCSARHGGAGSPDPKQVASLWPVVRLFLSSGKIKPFKAARGLVPPEAGAEAELSCPLGW